MEMTNSEQHKQIAQEQVGRFQEILYEFIKGLSKLQRDQKSFDHHVSESSPPTSSR